jgi:hypothetical protein
MVVGDCQVPARTCMVLATRLSDSVISPAMLGFLNWFDARKMSSLRRSRISGPSSFGEENFPGNRCCRVKKRIALIPRELSAHNNLREGDKNVIPCLLGRSAVVDAQGDQVGHIRLAHAHDRVCASPVEFYGSIRLGNRTADEDYVVHIASDLPRILRL